MKIPSLAEARKEFARLRLEYLNSYKGGENGEGGNIILEDHKDKQDKYERYASYIYSFPHLKPFIHAWMIDIKFGTEIPYNDKKSSACEELSEELVELVATNPQEFSAKTGGPLISSIETDLKSMGFKITDRGFGCGGGHIGCPCTDLEKELLISFMWMKYNNAIRSGLIFPKVAWFKPYFRDLWNKEDIENIQI